MHCVCWRRAQPRDPTTGRAGPSAGMHDVLTVLADYCVESFFPAAASLPGPNKYLGAWVRRSSVCCVEQGHHPRRQPRLHAFLGDAP